MSTLRTGKLIEILPSNTIGPGDSKFTVYINENLSQYATCDIFVDLTVVSGSDSILFQVYHSPTKTGTVWTLISGANFGGAKTAIGKYCQQLTQFAGYLAILVTTSVVDSTATFTFSISIFPKS
jgi:hypothetical protein